MDPFGWRSATALVGTLTVTVTALIAFLLFQRAVWIYVAGGLLATEHLSVVMSRTAILDAHLAFWIAVGFLFLVLDRRWIDRRQAAADAAVAAERTQRQARARGSHPQLRLARSSCTRRRLSPRSPSS